MQSNVNPRWAGLKCEVGSITLSASLLLPQCPGSEPAPFSLLPAFPQQRGTGAEGQRGRGAQQGALEGAWPALVNLRMWELVCYLTRQAARDYNIGESPDPLAVQVAAQCGIKVDEAQQARMFMPAEDIVDFDLSRRYGQGARPVHHTYTVLHCGVLPQCRTG